jgi:hypothetical protein
MLRMMIFYNGHHISRREVAVQRRASYRGGTHPSMRRLVGYYMRQIIKMMIGEGTICDGRRDRI